MWRVWGDYHGPILWWAQWSYWEDGGKAAVSWLQELLHLTIRADKHIGNKVAATNRSKPWVSRAFKPNDKGKVVEVDSRFKKSTWDASKNAKPEQRRYPNTARTRDITFSSVKDVTTWPESVLINVWWARRHQHGSGRRNRVYRHRTTFGYSESSKHHDEPQRDR